MSDEHDPGDWYEEGGRILHKQPWHARKWRRKYPPPSPVFDDDVEREAKYVSHSRSLGEHVDDD